MEAYNFWVFRDKLLGVLFLITEEAGASFDRTDFQAIRYGIMDTDAEAEKYFDYTFVSENDLSIRFAQFPDDTHIISLQVCCDNPETILYIRKIDQFQSYFDSWELKGEDYFN